MLFTTLTATEEASLSGGNTTPTPTPVKKPTPKPKKYKYFPYGIGSIIVAPVTQIAVNVNTGAVAGDLTQAAQNNNLQAVKL